MKWFVTSTRATSSPYRSTDILAQTKGSGLAYRFVQLLCGLGSDAGDVSEAAKTKLQRRCLVQVLRDIKARVADRKSVGETLTVLQQNQLPVLDADYN